MVEWVRSVRLSPGLPLLLAVQCKLELSKMRKSSMLLAGNALKEGLFVEAEAFQNDASERFQSLIDLELARASMLWAQAALMSRAAVLPRDGNSLVLAPIADFANHAPTFDTANAELHAESTGSVALVARRRILPGEEICHCYEELCNEQLLFSYGFVLDANPNTGFMCPLHSPTGAAKSQLLYRIITELRQASGVNMSMPHVPILGLQFDVRELVLSLKLRDISEEEAGKLLTQPSVISALEPRPGDLQSAVDFLDTWESHLQMQPSDFLEIHSGAWKPLLELQAEMRKAICAARQSILQEIPLFWSLYSKASRVLKFGRNL